MTSYNYTRNESFDIFCHYDVDTRPIIFGTNNMKILNGFELINLTHFQKKIFNYFTKKIFVKFKKIKLKKNKVKILVKIKKYCLIPTILGLFPKISHASEYTFEYVRKVKNPKKFTIPYQYLLKVYDNYINYFSIISISKLLKYSNSKILKYFNYISIHWMLDEIFKIGKILFENPAIKEIDIDKEIETLFFNFLNLFLQEQIYYGISKKMLIKYLKYFLTFNVFFPFLLYLLPNIELMEKFKKIIKFLKKFKLSGTKDLTTENLENLLTNQEETLISKEYLDYEKKRYNLIIQKKNHLIGLLVIMFFILMISIISMIFSFLEIKKNCIKNDTNLKKPFLRILGKETFALSYRFSKLVKELGSLEKGEITSEKLKEIHLLQKNVADIVVKIANLVSKELLS